MPSALAVLGVLVRQLQGRVRSGIGSPEGLVAAVRGAVYLRDDGGAGTTLYVKEADNIAGDPTKGWVAK